MQAKKPFRLLTSDNSSHSSSTYSRSAPTQCHPSPSSASSAPPLPSPSTHTFPATSLSHSTSTAPHPHRPPPNDTLKREVSNPHTVPHSRLPKPQEAPAHPQKSKPGIPQQTSQPMRLTRTRTTTSFSHVAIHSVTHYPQQQCSTSKSFQALRGMGKHCSRKNAIDIIQRFATLCTSPQSMTS